MAVPSGLAPVNSFISGLAWMRRRLANGPGSPQRLETATLNVLQFSARASTDVAAVGNYRRLSGVLPVNAEPDQGVCGVDMQPNSVHVVAT